jgi:hypothetical protein
MMALLAGNQGSVFGRRQGSNAKTRQQCKMQSVKCKSQNAGRGEKGGLSAPGCAPSSSILHFALCILHFALLLADDED